MYFKHKVAFYKDAILCYYNTWKVIKMIYNFDEIIERRDTSCIKWDRSNDEDVLPMWIADMDFKAAQPILDAVQRKLDIGIFGYTLHSKAYFDAISQWWGKRYNFKIEKDWIVFCTGVVPALSYVIRTFTEPGDKVLIQSPVYNAFYRVITNNKCETVVNDLIFNGEKYEIDFEDLQRKASDPKVKLFILCSPHNPAGRVWTKDELVRIGEICIEHGVLVIADEIHCDLVFGGYKYIPFASISEEFKMNSITCTSPSKTFNMAGLQVSNMIIPNGELKDKVKSTLYINEIGEINVIGEHALIAAYTQGEEWLEQLIEYLGDNLKYLNSFIKNNLPKLKVVSPEATYLIWIDCRKIGIKSKELTDKLLKDEKLWINPGSVYGENGEGFIRINIACPRELLVEGLKRFEKVVSQL